MSRRLAPVVRHTPQTWALMMGTAVLPGARSLWGETLAESS